ncbi:hypothetical protein [Nitrosomonas sp. Nm166]|uniref:hypothetical protein n=1 Tax=Nitrosomonas sp. Nm166 TaxID=1881054 RepID=UPI0008E62EC9|nr:hypothetical protein [Nitrosomonas sp. Nm166]SFE28169.1 hypothetical protein SAMN05428977_101158 [Nitrosomonas sp. Nm166]
MQSFKFSAKLSVLAIALLAFGAQMNASVAAQTEVAGNDHQALVKHYENLAKEAKVRLQENLEVLKEYEAHPYYFGRQGQDVRSHASANIREYEKALKENLDNADLHRRMAMEQNRDFTTAKTEHSGNKGL